MNLRKLMLSAALCAAIPAQAAENEFLQCASRADDAERLKCYDDLASAQQRVIAQIPAANPAPAGSSPATPSTATPASGIALPEIVAQPAVEHHHARKERSYLTRAWNLDGRAREGGTQLTPLRPYHNSYLIARTSSRPNTQPTSPAPGHVTPVPLDHDALEAKFQFSFKAEVMNYRHIDLLGFEDFRLWGAYTQQSNWQAFNARNSSPFRETSYEPELIATFGTGNSDSALKLVNLGLVHQSNGQGGIYSRSWNRVYLQGGWEWDNSLSVLARGWWRVPEALAKDDNPDIRDFLGSADAVIRWEPDKTQAVSLLLRNNLYLSQNRGFLQLDWTTPVFIGKSAKLHAQLSTGYGESLIDYNHRQTTLGLGVSFREW